MNATTAFRLPAAYIALSLVSTLVLMLGIFLLVAGQPAFIPETLQLHEHAWKIIAVGVAIMALDAVYFISRLLKWKNRNQPSRIKTVDRLPR